jgi:hypothetical protein
MQVSHSRSGANGNSKPQAPKAREASNSNFHKKYIVAPWYLLPGFCFPVQGLDLAKRQLERLPCNCPVLQLADWDFPGVLELGAWCFRASARTYLRIMIR